jgi:hypothetical protein
LQTSRPRRGLNRGTKRPKDKPERLAIEKRLPQLEAFVQHVAFLTVPPSVWWSQQFFLRQAVPTLPVSPGLPREVKEMRREMREMPVEPWKYLVRRAHPWEKQRRQEEQ